MSKSRPPIASAINTAKGSKAKAPDEVTNQRGYTAKI